MHVDWGGEGGQYRLVMHQWQCLAKINAWFHLEDTRWDEETVTLTADDHICLICSIEFLVRTEKDEYFAGMNV